MIGLTPIFHTSSWQAGHIDDAATIAAELNTAAALRPLTLLSLFQAAVAQGADPAELAKVWPVSEFVQRFEATIADGDLAGAQAMLATIPVALDPATLAAVQAVITANTLTAGQANWPEFDEQGNPTGDPPATFDAAWVESTLTAAGYTWNGTQWVRA